MGKDGREGRDGKVDWGVGTGLENVLERGWEEVDRAGGRAGRAGRWAAKTATSGSQQLEDRAMLKFIAERNRWPYAYLELLNPMMEFWPS